MTPGRQLSNRTVDNPMGRTLLETMTAKHESKEEEGERAQHNKLQG